MSKKFLGILAFVSFLLSGAYADDILAIVSNGQLTSKSAGVKELSLEERMQVKGGYAIDPNIYFYRDSINKTMEIAITAAYTSGEEEYIKNYIKNYQGLNPKISLSGLCGIDQISCVNPSERRMTDWLHATNWYLDMRPVYIVKRQVKISSAGQPYVLFSYSVGVRDANTGQLYRYNSTTSSVLLNNNMVIKEMANQYKEKLESTIGGWNARVW